MTSISTTPTSAPRGQPLTPQRYEKVWRHPLYMRHAHIDTKKAAASFVQVMLGGLLESFADAFSGEGSSDSGTAGLFASTLMRDHATKVWGQALMKSGCFQGMVKQLTQHLGPQTQNKQHDTIQIQPHGALTQQKRSQLQALRATLSMPVSQQPSSYLTVHS